MRWIPVILCLLLSSPSLAQSSTERRDAVSLIEKGNVAYESREYESALSHYLGAFRITPDARILYRIGLTYEHLGNYQRAREHFELHLQQNPTHENHDRIQQKIVGLRQAEADQSFVVVRSIPDGGHVFLGDFEASGTTPIRLPVHPGTHVLRVKYGEQLEERLVMIGRGETVSEHFEFDSKREEEPAAIEVAEVPLPEPSVQVENRVVNSHVSFKPPAALNALGWGGLIGGFWLGALGVIVGDGRVIGGGLAMMGAGGYTIFIHDWTNRLPDAPNPNDSKAWSLNFRIGF